MTGLKDLYLEYGAIDHRDLGSAQLTDLRDKLKGMPSEEIRSAGDGEQYISLVQKFRKAIEENDKLHGENYLGLINSVLSVGEDGLYSNDLRFIFELIQNVDDCDFENPENCELDMWFDFNSDQIVLTYNESGFTPFNVFAITGIAEAAKNISASKIEIGEKGIGFKSVFGVADHVLIESGWFSFVLNKENFTIPVAQYGSREYRAGTRMTLFVHRGNASVIYNRIKNQYCHKDAIFTKNPLLFLNKLTSLKFHYDSWRSMEFSVTRHKLPDHPGIYKEDDIVISVDLHDSNDRLENKDSFKEEILCTRYIYPVVYSHDACRARYGHNTVVGSDGGKHMVLQSIVPHVEYIDSVGNGALYSFLPTQLGLSVPIICHVPFKLDASREFVDPQNENLWFRESCEYLSDLMDHTYSNLCRSIHQEILRYLPVYNESLFAKNNGKEKCLSRQQCFSGAHFLDLKVLYTVDGTLMKSDEIIAFNPLEQIPNQAEAHRLLGLQKALFIPPQVQISLHKYNIHVENHILDRLFIAALKKPEITENVIHYLDEAGYEYNYKIGNGDKLAFTQNQLECLLRCAPVFQLLRDSALTAIRSGKRPSFSVLTDVTSPITELLYDDFDISEAPRLAEQYLNYCGSNCLAVDIGNERYLPCQNALILSENGALDSFTSFCFDLDPDDSFSKRQKLRKDTKDLNAVLQDDSTAADEFIRDLRNIRASIKDNIGKEGYESYIKLILKSGTNKQRFIHELLQNADDCKYPYGVTPTFILKEKKASLETEYNEIGFSRADIRSITAIGESTKSRILNKDFATIGEKGVGFKTVFTIASSVRIHSGEYHFQLTDREPTIPKLIKDDCDYQEGTRMEINLKNPSFVKEYSDRDLLNLCLCLRRLKRVEIGSKVVTISDSENTRTITVGNRKYSFWTYIHSFEITDERAIKECETAARKINAQQQITCYIPKTNALQEYDLYCGLPTHHKLRIPMAIDAPFELTTSREQIESDCHYWNSIVRDHMYQSILEVMDNLKEKERADIFRFLRFVPRREGLATVYKNDITGNERDYLTEYPLLDNLKKHSILPTCNPSFFGIPAEKSTLRYPSFVNTLLEINVGPPLDQIKYSSVVDVPSEYDSIINALEIETADFRTVFPIIEEYSETYITNKTFRDNLYSYLMDAPEVYKDALKGLAIIPVYGESGGTEFIPWQDETIFVKRNTYVSGKQFRILNETILEKSSCEKIFDVHINEMNSLYEKDRYNENLRAVLRKTEIEDVYNYLLSEFKNGNLKRYDSAGILLEAKDIIPLKNQLGEITDQKLFISDEPQGYFPTKMIMKIAVHEECSDLAHLMRCEDLKSIHYESFNYTGSLTEDDLETLLDDYFTYSEEILRGFYRDNQISDELINAYNLEYLTIGRSNEDNGCYQFPEQPVSNLSQLRNHVRRQWEKPIPIISVVVERSIRKGRKPDGSTFELNINDARNGALSIYTPDGETKRCFCQMCHSLKDNGLMEVNNIEIEPNYYFPQMRIALCLECSKRFETLRSNPVIREGYLSAMSNTTIGEEGTVDIPVGQMEHITFTATHLAEIQEILRLKKSK